jgi:hypothetical protein
MIAAIGSVPPNVVVEPMPYYVAYRNQKYGAGATAFGTLPAEHIEDLVLTQVMQALFAQAIVQAVWDQVRASTDRLTKPEVVLAMRQLGKFWSQLFPAEQYRLLHLLIERVLIGDNGLEIV